MRPLRYVLPLVGAAALAFCSPAQAAPSVLGPSGDLLTPTNRFLPARSLNGGFHILLDVDKLDDEDIRIFKANYGVMDRLEAGFTVFDVGGGTFSGKEVTVNAKYLLLTEAQHGVAVSVGVFDLTDELDLDPGIYIYVSKDITSLLGRKIESGAPGSLEVGAGVGGGIYNGFFANGRLHLTKNLDVFAEFLDDAEAIADGATVNVGARLYIGRNLTIDSGLFDLDNFGVGLTFTTAPHTKE
ncbi:MAG: hypothetical protein HY320_05600 [Armatimonadetes bacterium]|nr:hypothetical protein [Armatimonadota bacterium]